MARLCNLYGTLHRAGVSSGSDHFLRFRRAWCSSMMSRRLLTFSGGSVDGFARSRRSGADGAAATGRASIKDELDRLHARVLAGDTRSTSSESACSSICADASTEEAI